MYRLLQTALLLIVAFATTQAAAQCAGGRCYGPAPTIMVPQTTWQPVQSYQPVTTYQPAQLSGYAIQTVDPWYPGKAWARWWGNIGRRSYAQPIYTVQPQATRQQQPAQPNYKQSYEGPTPPQWNQPSQ